jgi:2'-5' RNA ligase
MTIKGVFEASDTEIEKLSTQIEKVAKRHKPFKLHTSRVSSFTPVTNAIYFKVEPTQELLNLHEDLHSEELGTQAEYSFVPHITIAQKMGSGEHDDIFGQLKMVGVDHEEIIDRLHLLYQLEDGSWTVYETFRLSGAGE